MKGITKVLLQAAREAGRIQKHYFYLETRHKKIRKKGYKDLVTKADFECEERIISIIKKSFPEHSILAEESGHEKKDSDYTWVIDPLDGTKNFSKELEMFCVSIAIAHGKDVIMGVILDPMRNHLFFAEKGKGAFLNGRRIRVSNDTRFDTSLMFTPIDPITRSLDRKIERRIHESLLRKAFQVNSFHSFALELCYIAKGSAGGVAVGTSKPMDFAAGALIVEEAGGKVTDIDGRPWSIQSKGIVATNRLLHNKVMRIVKG